jgi:5'-methylthioadenosine phosphorylase
MHQSFGCDVVGMTNMPEAKLAREAELCYCSVAMVTDFDCWHPDHDHVQVSDIIRVLHANSANAKQLVQRVIPRIGADEGPCEHGCDRVLEYAIVTAPGARDAELVNQLDAIAGRVLRKGGST